MSTHTEIVDVAVVGLGPVGATLAGLLAGRGLRVAALDREADVFPLPRAAHIDHQGLRILQELGCLDELLPGMQPNPGLEFVTADQRTLVQVPGTRANRSGLPPSMYFHQPDFDRRIRTAVEASPTATSHVNRRVVGLEHDDDRVTLSIVDPDDEPVPPLSARWVVGCDGARSTVRDLLGLEFEDLGCSETWLVIDVHLTREAPNLPDHAVTGCDPARPYTLIPTPGDRYRFELMVLPGEEPAELERDETVLRLLAPWLDREALELERQAVYTFHGRLAQRWREGRVLLAGDAAHLMPPFLGQGMNSGLRDAANLAWKIDAVLRGGAPSHLLDTYEAERRPHVRRIIETAVELGRVACVLDSDLAAERDRLMLAGEPPPGGEQLAFGLPPLPPGPLVLAGGGELFVQPQTDDTGARLDDHVGPRFLVLARDAAALEGSADWWREAVGAHVTTLDELPDEGGRVASWMERCGGLVAVVRPDRYVLATGAGLDDVTAAVRSWLAPGESSTGTRG